MTGLLVDTRYGFNLHEVRVKKYGQVWLLDDTQLNLLSTSQFQPNGSYRQQFLNVVTNDGIARNLALKNKLNVAKPDLFEISLGFVRRTALWSIYQRTLMWADKEDASEQVAWNLTVSAFQTWNDHFNFDKIQEHAFNKYDSVNTRRKLHWKSMLKSLSVACEFFEEQEDSTVPTYPFFGVYDLDISGFGLPVEEFSLRGLVEATMIFNFMVPALNSGIIIWTAKDSSTDAISGLKELAEKQNVPLVVISKYGMLPNVFLNFLDAPRGSE